MSIRALRGVFGVVSALVASVTLAGAQPADLSARETELYAGAKTEGSVTWYVSQFNTEVADKICSLFNERYADVACNPVRATGQVVFQRLMQEINAGALQADIFSTNDVGQLVELKATDKLAEYSPDSLQYMVPSLRQFGEEGFWFTTSVAPFIIAYNTNLVTKEEAPKNWPDLADPKWKDQGTIPHPGFSGSAGTWAISMTDLYGWEYFEKLAANQPQVGRSVTDGANLIISGERKVGVVPATRVATEAAKGSPIAPIYPTDGALLPPGSTGLLKDSPHPNAAKLFAEFMLSKEVADFYVSDQRPPLRVGIEPPKGLPPLSDMKLIMVPNDKVLKELPEIQEKFRDTFGI